MGCIMTWYLPKIPKVAHFYWGAPTLPYLRYLTIRSFMNWNPDWYVKVYIPKNCITDKSWCTFEQKYEVDTHDYMPKLQKIKRDFEIVVVDSEKYRIRADASEVIKSDLFRWYILAAEGGLWSDMDIIYFKSLEDSCLNDKSLSDKDTFVSINKKYGHSIGFFLSSGGNSFFEYLHNNANHYYNPSEYQSVGSSLLNKKAKNIEQMEQWYKVKAHNIPMDLVYAYNAIDVEEIYHQDKLARFTKDTIGMHWYAGHHFAADAVNNMNHVNYKYYNNVISRTISLSYQRCVTDTIDRLNKEGFKVLDLGCGTKEISDSVTLKNLTTLDAWPKFKPDILHDLNTLPLPIEKDEYDIAILVDVIEHLEKDAGLRLLEELRHKVKSHILVLTPLQWNTNDSLLQDKESAYYGNTFNLHKSLWLPEDFVGFEQIFPVGYLKNYYFGLWSKVV